MSTFKSGAAYVKALEKRLKKVDDAIFLEVSTTQDQFMTRVFDEGRNAKGVKYGGNYQHKGKKKGQYSYSYGLKRQAAGRQVSFVNLQFNGDMRRDLGSAPKKSGKKIQIGFFGSGGSGGVTNADKWAYNEERYGDLSKLSQTENKELLERIDKSVTKILAGA